MKMTEDNRNPNAGEPIDLDSALMSASDLALWGMDEVAYVRPVTTEDGRQAAGIFAADGERIGVAPDEEIAAAAAIQEGLLPLRVH